MADDRGPHIEEVEVDPALPQKVQEKIVESEARNARAGRIVGFVVILLGVVLTLLGATGAVNIELGGAGLTAHVANAAPGVVLMLIGLFVVWRTNLSIKAVQHK